MSEVTIKEVNYKEYGKCVEISNGIVDLLVTVGVGPRVIRYGFVGEANEFCEAPQMSQNVGMGEYKIKGGHRLWHSPEGMPRSYVPDNAPVKYTKLENGIKVEQDVEPWVQMQKEIEVTLSPDSSHVKLVHKITNKGAWPVEFAAWSVTMAAQGGKEVVPQPQRETGLLGNRTITLWPYSKMNDHRVYWGEKYVTLQNDPKTAPAFKFGITDEDGWAAYFNHGNIFVKRFNHDLNAKYPDYGVSYESYVTDYMVEMESLSPLVKVDPEASITHVEEWDLVKGVETPSNDDAEIDKIVEKYIRK